MTDCAVLVPTKSRPGALIRTFRRCPSLDCASTFVGIEYDELDLYRTWRKMFPRAIVVDVVNPHGVPSQARECLRRAVLNLGYARYLSIDDEHSFTPQSMTNLVEANRRYEQRRGPCFIAGLHPTHKFFHTGEMAVAESLGPGLSTFRAVSTIYWTIPHEFYVRYSYPEDIHCDDIHAALTAMKWGFTQFRICPQAPFNAPSWQPGGSGSPAERVKKLGRGMIRLAQDFPDWITRDFLSLRVPYGRILESVELQKRQKEKVNGKGHRTTR